MSRLLKIGYPSSNTITEMLLKLLGIFTRRTVRKYQIKLILSVLSPNTGGSAISNMFMLLANKTGVNIALRCFLHNHGNIATEGSPKPGLCPTLILNDFKGLL